MEKAREEIAESDFDLKGKTEIRQREKTKRSHGFLNNHLKKKKVFARQIRWN